MSKTKTQANDVDIEKIIDFWKTNVDSLDSGTLNSATHATAYEVGSVVTDYSDRIDGLSQKKILNGDRKFLSRLTADQLLGCIAWHFRAAHFDNYHFNEPEYTYALQRIVRQWLLAVEGNDQSTIDEVVYTFRSRPLAPPNALDWTVKVKIRPDGSVKVSKYLQSRETGRRVKGTTKNESINFQSDKVEPLVEAASKIKGMINKKIELPICDAISYMQIKSSAAPRRNHRSTEPNEKTAEFESEFIKLLKEVSKQTEFEIPHER